MGTIDYVAPEQVRGEQVDGNADQYALTCLIFECLTGTLPFQHKSELETIFAHLEERAAGGELAPRRPAERGRRGAGEGHGERALRALRDLLGAR